VRRIKTRTCTERQDKDKSTEKQGHHGHNKHEKINMVWTCQKNAGRTMAQEDVGLGPK